VHLVQQEAMDASLRSDKALPLLDAAADKFAEVTISGAAALSVACAASCVGLSASYARL
jgi:hypothetical protein